MKGKIRFIPVLVLFLLILAGCSTSVRLDYMRPAEINMGKYRNIAIASTVPYEGRISYPHLIRALDPVSAMVHMFSTYDSKTPDYVADYATDALFSTLSSTGFFDSILSPAGTDTILGMRKLGYDPSVEFVRNGYDAVLIPKVEIMGFDEFIWSEKKIVKVYDEELKKSVEKQDTIYRIKRVANIMYSITVLDCKTNQIVTKKTYHDSYEWVEVFNPKSYHFTVDGRYMFRSMIDEILDEVLEDFIPRRVSYYADLMSNKPKLEAAKPAYECAKDGNMHLAASLFKECWEQYGHVPSGYNYALLTAGYGEYDLALSILENLMRYSSDSDIIQLHGDLMLVKERDEKANAQLEGLAEGDMPGQSNPNATIYDYIMN